MATEKQIRANRENAKRSTGPKSAAGRLKSSRNALRHGLSALPSAEARSATQQSPLAQLVVSEVASEQQKFAVFEFAEAQAQLQRIAIIRGHLMADLDLGFLQLEQVQRLKALERYEVRAHRQRRRATDRLAQEKRQE